MPIVTMTVKYINLPKPGKQRGTIKGTDDQFIGVFADKIKLFEVGKTYDIDYSETVSGDVTYKNVKSATLVASAPEPQRAQQTSNYVAPAANASAAFPEGVNRQTHPVDAERMFVCSTLNAFIQAGKIHMDPKELIEATTLLRRLWHHTFNAEAVVDLEQRRA